MNIETTTNPSKEDEKTISEGIVNFNQAKIPDLEPNDKPKGHSSHYLTKDLK